MNNENYLRKLETSMPTKSGMYLRLLHGRTAPDADMDDWGPNGPYIGPLAWCHFTYLSFINLCAAGDDEGTGPMGEGDPMYFHNDLLYYDGMYYGDFELEVL
jgi:hypothetical protein